jgi:hypothetical protein
MVGGGSLKPREQKRSLEITGADCAPIFSVRNTNDPSAVGRTPGPSLPPPTEDCSGLKLTRLLNNCSRSPRPRIDGGAIVVKPTKYFRKQAVKAEMAAGRIDDPEISTEMLAMASAYRSQADILKKNKKADKKHRAKTSHGR